MTRNLVAILTVVILGAPAAADEEDEVAVEKLARDLELGEEQRLKLRDIADEARKERVRARAEMEVLEIDLRRELDRDAPDERRVVDLVEKLAAAEARTRKARILASLRVKRLLSAEQRAQLEEGRPPRARAPRAPAPPPPRAADGAYETALREAREAYGERRFVRALARAEDALEVRPADPGAASVAGMAACQLGNADVARKHLRRVPAARAQMVRQVCLTRGVRVDEGWDAGAQVGYLTVNTKPWSRVVIDGQDSGLTTPVARLELTPGRHVVTFVVGTKKFAHSVTIEPGEEVRLVKSLQVDPEE